MALCINCNILIRANQQYEYDALCMGPEIVLILEEWTVQEVIEGDCICQQCIELLLVELNNRNENIIGDRQLGHQSVCICCGISLSRRTGRRSRPLPDNHPEQAHIASIIEPRQMPANARVCNACWQRAHNHVQEPMEPSRDDILECRSSLFESSSETDFMSVTSSDFETDSVHQNENKYIELDGYTRTPDTSGHCFIPDCINRERLRVPLYLRKQILIDYKLYITRNARVCNEHVSVYNWELLTEFDFTTQFSVTHITEMLDLLIKKTNNTVRFRKYGKYG